jgi:hypothetical protein
MGEPVPIADDPIMRAGAHAADLVQAMVDDPATPPNCRREGSMVLWQYGRTVHHGQQLAALREKLDALTPNAIADAVSTKLDAVATKLAVQVAANLKTHNEARGISGKVGGWTIKNASPLSLAVLVVALSMVGFSSCNVRELKSEVRQMASRATAAQAARQP